MIQRIQSIWLLLAGVAGLLTYKLPLWKGTLQDGSVKEYLGPESLLLFTLIVATSVLAFVTIFLFRNRSQQKGLALIGALLSVAIVALEFFLVEDYKKTLNLAQNTWQIGAILPILMIILFFMARSGIVKDEKLVKSLDRLR
jgi:glycerol-3-phosphate acyltransferase PlsY